MNHKFLPHTNEEIRQMLDRIGFKDLDKLYSEIPEEIRFKGECNERIRDSCFF